MALFACNHGQKQETNTVKDSLIPAPEKSVKNFSKVVGWDKDKLAKSYCT